MACDVRKIGSWYRSRAFDWSKVFCQDEKNKKIKNWEMYSSRTFHWSKVFCQDEKNKK
jgi:hypothetical protein